MPEIRLTGPWTSEKPTVPGWYGRKEADGAPRIVAVYQSMFDGKLAVGGWRLEEFIGGEWLGPIVLPE